MSRASYLLHTEQQLLHDWGWNVRRSFNGKMPYLVGSCLERPNFRDVDVRVLLDEVHFNRLEKIVGIEYLNLAYSLWGQKVTGMPIDFQVQNQQEANAEYHGRRHAIGTGQLGRPSEDGED